MSAAMTDIKQKIIGHPLTGRAASIQQVLRDLASQEGCDGEPYDECIEAARYIDELEHELRLAQDVIAKIKPSDRNQRQLLVSYRRCLQ